MTSVLAVPDSVVGGDAAPATQFIQHQEFPAEWMRRLREISPVTDVHSWLMPRWFAQAQRWVLYDCVPIKYVSDNVLIEDLQGPDPDTPEGATVTVSRFQQEMFREHRVYARPAWIIQGKSGGHPAVFSESTKELCKAYGLPTEPPKAGDQPYAPFDERVVQQLMKASRLYAVRGDLGAFKKTYGNVENWKREKREQMRQARTVFVKALNEWLDVGDEEIVAGVKKGEVDDAPTTDSEFVKENEEWDERFINKGL